MSNPIVGESGVEGGSGVVTTKTQRVVLATDVTPPTHPVTANAGTNLNTSALALEAGGNLAGATTSLAVIDDWDESDRAKVNPIVGQAGIAAGTGVDGVTVPRVTLATNVALPAGDNNIGNVDVVTLPALSAGTANIGDVDVLTVPAPLSTAGGGTEATAHRVTIANDSTGVLSVDDNGASLTVDYATTGSGTATGALRVELPTNGTGVIATVGAVTALTNALPAGSNAIGKLAANSGVDIGDVDVASIAAGTNAIGNIGVIPRTTGGLTTYHLVSAGSTNATVVKASAGQLFGWYIYNNNAAMRKLAFHNTASTPTAGAAIFFTLNIPATAGANVFLAMGIAFSAGIAITTVTDVTDAGTTAVAASDLTINLFYA